MLLHFAQGNTLMKNINIKLLSALLFLPVLSTSFAAEQPTAQDLVGKFYVGLHGALMSPDDDRVEYLNTTFEDAYGLGAEVGYRYSPEVEFRFSYTDFTYELDNGYPDETGSAMSIDALYFINQKNLYLLGGLNNLDIEKTEVSANLGAGYRYFFNEKLASYIEGKAHYQFDESYIDYTAQVGIAYFFGTTSQKAVSQPAPTPANNTSSMKAAPVDIDSDKDGIFDRFDECESTPTSDKVDDKGCTLFTEKTLTQRLLINFDNNQSVIKPAYYGDVEKLAKFLKTYPNVDVTIAGHSSSQGSSKYNQTLSQKRAESVVELLTNKYGIEASRLDAQGFGETKLINLENTQEAHNENRRIEALVKAQKSIPVKK